LYLRAEIENLKRLMEKEVERARVEASERLLLTLISIYEELERAYEGFMINSDQNQIVKGLELIVRETRRTLSDLGVDRMETVGRKFDPFIHEAVGFIERDDVEEETVVAEISRGYVYAGRLLKPPRVIVARRARPTASAPDTFNP